MLPSHQARTASEAPGGASSLLHRHPAAGLRPRRWSRACLGVQASRFIHRQQQATRCSAAAGAGNGDGSHGWVPPLPSQRHLPRPVGTKSEGPCRQVLQLVKQQADACSAANLATAASTMADRHRRCMDPEQLADNHAAFRSLADLAFRQLAHLDALAQLFTAAAAMQAPFNQQQQAAWECRVSALLPGASAAAVGSILWGYGALSLRPGSSLGATLRRELQRALQGGQPWVVANALWGASRLHWRLREQEAAAAEAAVVRYGRAFSAQQVCGILSACARGDCWQPGAAAAAAALKAALLRTLPAADAQAADCVVRAVLQLGWQREGELAEAADAAILRNLVDKLAEQAAEVKHAYRGGRGRLSGQQKEALLAVLGEMEGLVRQYGACSTAPTAIGSQQWRGHKEGRASATSASSASADAVP